MLLALVVLPNFILSTSTFNHPDGMWGDVMCKTITGDCLTFYLSVVSEYSLILISLERLRAIRKFPVSVSNTSTKPWRVWASILIAWIIPLALEGPKAIYLLEYKRERKPTVGSYCTFVWGREPDIRARIYGAVILFAEGLVPLLIFIYSFYNIRKCLLKEEKGLSRRIGAEDSFDEGYKYYICWQIVERRHRTVKILMIATAVFLVCWMPTKIMFFVTNYIGEEHTDLTWNSSIYQIGILIAYTGSCINPFLYALQSGEFRKHTKTTLRSLCPKCFDDDFHYSQIEFPGQRSRNRNIDTPKQVTTRVERESPFESTATDFQSEADTETDTSRPNTRTPRINAVV